MLGLVNFGVNSVIADNGKILTFLAAVLGVASTLPVFAQSYEYVNPLNKRHTISIQALPPSFATGDRAVIAEFCSPSDNYVCMSSTEFSFAFPIAKKPEVKKWEYRGYSYELIAQEQMRVLGTSFKFGIVESVQDGKKIRYSYSEQYGLMAFSVELSDASNTFLSVHRVGFGGRLK